ncbi:hypothetical protein RB601_005956 [Gaeumannomyces tritici]
MIAGSKSPTRSDAPPGKDRNRDRGITAPRRDPANRVSKPSRNPNNSNNNRRPPHSNSGGGAMPPPATNNPRHFKTQDEQSEEFVAGEDKFVLRQSKKKADIRVRERRAKPADFLAFNLRWVDEDRDTLDDDEADVAINVPRPAKLIAGLSERQLDGVEAEIRSYLTLETSARNLEYWSALQALCADHRKQLGRPEGGGGGSGSGSGGGGGEGGGATAAESVAASVDKLLGPKSYEQLEALEKQIRAKLDSNEQIDPDYWENLLKSLLVYKAKARLNVIMEEIHQVRLELLKNLDPQALANSNVLSRPPQGAKRGTSILAWTTTKGKEGKSKDGKTVEEAVEGSSSSSSTTLVKAGSSTAPAAPGAAPPGTARFAQGETDDFSQAAKALYERELARGVGEDEVILTAEETLTKSKPWWANKHRPRKPRYFNRVQMGYEWNKYNQTHYDHDNPPPRTVHGYRFNIFYPDLIDKTKAPTFKIIREGGRRRGETTAPAGQEDTCLIRFIAGPPYEDIAFRIVDKEWDYSAKRERGFRSSFDKVSLPWPCSFLRSTLTYLLPRNRRSSTFSLREHTQTPKHPHIHTYTHTHTSYTPSLRARLGWPTPTRAIGRLAGTAAAPRGGVRSVVPSGYQVFVTLVIHPHVHYPWPQRLQALVSSSCAPPTLALCLYASEFMWRLTFLFALGNSTIAFYVQKDLLQKIGQPGFREGQRGGKGTARPRQQTSLLPPPPRGCRTPVFRACWACRSERLLLFCTPLRRDCCLWLPFSSLGISELKVSLRWLGGWDFELRTRWDSELEVCPGAYSPSIDGQPFSGWVNPDVPNVGLRDVDVIRRRRRCIPSSHHGPSLDIGIQTGCFHLFSLAFRSTR